MSDLLEKLRAVEKRLARFEGSVPGATVIDRVLGPCEVVIEGRSTLMFGSNNYLGLTLHPEVIEAARSAVGVYGAGTTGSRRRDDRLAVGERTARHPRAARARFRGLVRQAARDRVQHRLSGESEHDRVL